MRNTFIPLFIAFFACVIKPLAFSLFSPHPLFVFLRHSGVGYCADQRALGAAADLEGAGLGKPPPVPAL